MMRLVAGVFLVLLNRYQGLANGAYVLVGWIGLKLIGSALHTAFESTRGTGGVLTRGDWRAVVPQPIREFPWEIPDWLFWVGMAVILVASLLVRRRPDSQPITIDQETLDSDTLEPEAEPKP
jgi:hypothetical protein